MGCGSSTASKPVVTVDPAEVTTKAPPPPAVEPTKAEASAVDEKSVDAKAVDAKAVGPADATQPAACTLRIIHVNDVYQLKNFPKLKTLIAEQSAGCKNVIVTLAGDFIAPSLLSALDQGVGMIAMLNAVGVTHICFGNHESDVPYEALKQRIAEYKGKWINSNMPGFSPQLPEHDVLSLTDEAGTEEARKVGLLGLLIGGIDAHGKNFGANYRDGALGGASASIEAVMLAHAKAAAKLRVAHPDVDCIIPLTHQDQKEDEELAATGEYAAVLAGHDHDLTITEHGPHATPVIKAGQDAHNAVICDVTWPAGAARGAWPEVTTTVKALKGYDKDEDISAAVKRAEAPVRELESATLAMLPKVELPTVATGVDEIELVIPSSKDARYGPSTMAMYLAESMRVCVSADVSLINSGAVRADTQYESVFTYADLQKECPFPSECIVIKMPGATLVEAVETSRAGWLTEGGPTEESGAFQHDLGCKCDATHKMTVAAKAPLDPERMYSVLVDSYDLAKDPVLSAYAKANPANIPPADAGRPAMTVLVEYFCRAMWAMLADSDGDGAITEEEIHALFTLCDADGSGQITAEELTTALAAKVGEGASKLVAKQMINIADKDESGTVDKTELTETMMQLAKTMKW